MVAPEEKKKIRVLDLRFGNLKYEYKKLRMREQKGWKRGND